MADTDKLESLRRFQHEDRFRANVLLTLLEKMGLSPRHTHGTNERGKDIVCEEQNAFSTTEWIAIVAKVGRIKGATSGSTSLQTILNQVQECFGYPYKDSVAKRTVSISKVYVITNDAINASAQDRIVDGLGGAGAAAANTHFVGAPQLVTLIDEHWPDFWRISTDLLVDEDLMSEDAGLVLYVVARAHVQSDVGVKKKVEKALPRNKIQRQTGLSSQKVDNALAYLFQTEYIEDKNDSFLLHRKKTVGYLLTDPNQIRLLFAILSIAAAEDPRFTLDGILEECKKPVLSFAPLFVKHTLTELVQGKYITKDESRGSNNFILNVGMIDDERPYLERHLKHLGRLPTRER